MSSRPRDWAGVPVQVALREGWKSFRSDGFAAASSGCCVAIGQFHSGTLGGLNLAAERRQAAGRWWNRCIIWAEIQAVKPPWFCQLFPASSDRCCSGHWRISFKPELLTTPSRSDHEILRTNCYVLPSPPPPRPRLALTRNVSSIPSRCRAQPATFPLAAVLLGCLRQYCW